MTTENVEFRNSLVAAVQAELERHASAVVAEVDRLRQEGQRERGELRRELQDALEQITSALEQVDSRATAQAEKTRTSLEQRVDESEKRQIRRLDDVTSGLENMVTQTARPLMADLRDENEALVKRVETLDGNLRRFDEQAARMVTYFNDVSQRMEARQDEQAESLKEDIARELAVLKSLVEENDSSVRKFQNEVGQTVSSRLNDAEDRFNNRLLAAENRIKDDAGQKLAEMDVHISRVSTNLDDSLGVMNDRIAALDDRFVETDRRIEAVAKSVEGVDQTALDEMRDKMSAAAGEAMLVRIEMERLEKGVSERADQLAVRLTDVETSLQDATLDVSTAVQLDRLEEIERALAELDPDQFVRKDGRDAPPSATAPPSMYDDDAADMPSAESPATSVTSSPTPPPPPPPPAPASTSNGQHAPGDDSGATPSPELPGGIDIGAIIAAAEAASDRNDH